MKLRNLFCLMLVILPILVHGQSDQHYTMFLFNKLLYNPGYAGNKDLTTINATYRDQWDAINGAPKTINLSGDGPVGSYMKSFRKVAVGFSLVNEKLGVENNTDLKAYYAYRIQAKKVIFSFGLSGGMDLYSANYSLLNLFQQNDPNFNNNIRNTLLPNFGAGIYATTGDAYLGISVPNMLQDSYDKNEVAVKSQIARQVRGYYLSAGYTYKINSTVKLLPQLLYKYSGNGKYSLPSNLDLNCSALFYDRFLTGITFRTDKSFAAIVHVQATQKINIGYSFDYLVSGLNGYNGGTHEVVIGYDFVKDVAKYHTPRFTKTF